MAINGLTFDNRLVKAQNDGTLYRHLSNDGVITGCEISCTATTVTIQPGHFIACGREVEIDQATTITVQNIIANGWMQLKFVIDLTGEPSDEDFQQGRFAYVFNATSGGFPALRQDDINGLGTIYELELAKVQVVSSALATVQSSNTNPNKYLPLTGGTMTGNITMQGHILADGNRNIGSTVSPWNRIYASDRLYLGIEGSTVSPMLSMSRAIDGVQYGATAYIGTSGQTVLTNSRGVTSLYAGLSQSAFYPSANINLGQNGNHWNILYAQTLYAAPGNSLNQYVRIRVDPDSIGTNNTVAAISVGGASGATTLMIDPSAPCFYPASSAVNLGSASKPWGTVYASDRVYLGTVGSTASPALYINRAISGFQYTAGLYVGSSGQTILTNSSNDTTRYSTSLLLSDMEFFASRNISLGSIANPWGNFDLSGAIIFHANSSADTYISESTDGELIFSNYRAGGHGTLALRGGSAFSPSPSELIALGTGSKLWRVVYAANGTIQTSDISTKSDIHRVADIHDADALSEDDVRSALEVAPITFAYKKNGKNRSIKQALKDEPEAAQIGIPANELKGKRAFDYLCVEAEDGTVMLKQGSVNGLLWAAIRFILRRLAALEGKSK